MRDREREKQGHRGEREGGRGDRKRERERARKGWWSTEWKGMTSARDGQSRLPGKEVDLGAEGWVMFNTKKEAK